MRLWLGKAVTMVSALACMLSLTGFSNLADLNKNPPSAPSKTTAVTITTITPVQMLTPAAAAKTIFIANPSLSPDKPTPSHNFVRQKPRPFVSTNPGMPAPLPLVVIRHQAATIPVLAKPVTVLAALKTMPVVPVTTTAHAVKNVKQRPLSAAKKLPKRKVTLARAHAKRCHLPVKPQRCRVLAHHYYHSAPALAPLTSSQPPANCRAMPLAAAPTLVPPPPYANYPSDEFHSPARTPSEPEDTFDGQPADVTLTEW